MQCESVRQTISLRDGRMLRGRRIRAHLEACEECRRFRASMATRGADLAAIAPPLPAAAASGLLGELLGHGASHATAGAAGTTLGGQAAAASLLGKGMVAAAAVAVAVGAVHVALRSHHAGGTSLRPMGAGHRVYQSPSAQGSYPRSAHSARASSGQLGSSVRGTPLLGTSSGVPGAAPGGAATGRGNQSEARQATPSHRRAPPGSANGGRGGYAGTHAAKHRSSKAHAPHSHSGASGHARSPQHGSKRRSGRHRETGTAQGHGQSKHEQPASRAPRQEGPASSHAGSEDGRGIGGTSGSSRAQRSEAAG
jgi:hypothetical protein